MNGPSDFDQLIAIEFETEPKLVLIKSFICKEINSMLIFYQRFIYQRLKVEFFNAFKFEKTLIFIRRKKYLYFFNIQYSV